MKRNLDKQELTTMYKLRKKAGYLQRSIGKSLPDSAQRSVLIEMIHALCDEIGATIEKHGISLIERDEINSKG